jgi:hypothetical protein
LAVASSLLRFGDVGTAKLPIPRPGEVLLYLRSHGPGRACRKLFAGYVAGREHWYLTIEDLSHWAGARPEPNGFEIRRATPDDLPLMSAFTARQHPDTLKSWCDARHVMFIALADGRAVSYRCLSRQAHAAVDRVLTLAPHQIYMVDEFTAPEFRRRGITRQLAIASNPTLVASGYREVVGIHRTDNNDTIAATRAKNIVTIGRLTRACLLSRTWYSYEPYVTDIAPPLAPSVPRRSSRAALLPSPQTRAA